MKKLIIFLIVFILFVSFAISMAELISENPKFNVHKVTEGNQEVLRFEVKEDVPAHVIIKEVTVEEVNKLIKKLNELEKKIKEYHG